MHFYNKMWVFLGVLCFSCALYDMIILNSTYTNSFSIFNGTTKITIEFFARQLLFYWIYPVYHALNDVVVVGVFVLVTIVLVVLFHSANISRENKIKLAVCVGATLIYSLITTIARGGLLVPYLNNYMTTMVDKYYYGLNIMTLIPIMFITEDLVKVRHWWGKGIGMIVSAWMVLSPVITLETMVEFTDPAMEGVTHEVSFRERLCTGFFDAQRDAYTVYIDPVGWHMNLPSKYVHASVQGKRHAQPLVVADITDQNWNNGVGMAIGIENGLLFTQESGEVLKYCDTLMAGSEEVKIMEVESSGEWIYVVCDTTDLDAFAYPNEITFTLKGSTGE